MSYLYLMHNPNTDDLMIDEQIGPEDTTESPDWRYVDATHATGAGMAINWLIDLAGGEAELLDQVRGHMTEGATPEAALIRISQDHTAGAR